MKSTSPKSIEIMKHRLASDLEERKWQFKTLELKYLEAGQHLRSLNQLMWQVPSMVIAITGGLWYGATTVDEFQARTVVLSFAAVFSLLTIVIIWRLRGLIQMHIERQGQFSPDNAHVPRGKYVVIGCWTTALLGSAIVSTLGACNPSHLSKKREPPEEAKCCVSQIEVVTNPVQPPMCPVQPPAKKQPTATSKPCAK